MSGDSLGSRIRAARRRAGLNRNQLARRLGTSWQHVDNWESGRVQPSLASMRSLAEVLGVTSDYLLGLRADFGGAPPSALEQFVAAQDDLTPEQERWLRDAPVEHETMRVEDYARLLRGVRGTSPSRPRARPSSRHPKSGPRAKVDRAEVEARIRKKLGEGD